MDMLHFSHKQVLNLSLISNTSRACYPYNNLEEIHDLM